MLRADYSVPGVYRQPAVREPTFPRPRTDVVGFVGVAGPNRVGEALRFDDWRSYEEVYLRDRRRLPIARPAGARLAETVRAYFTNGGARCWVVNVAATVDELPAEALLNLMLGLGATERVGLELLLAQPEVAMVCLPELDAVIEDPESRRDDTPIADEGRFVPCCTIRGPEVDLGHDPPDRRRVVPLYPLDPTPRESAYFYAQRYLIERCHRDRWRVFVLLGAPPGLDEPAVRAWRAALTDGWGTDLGEGAALYWPWLLVQDLPGAPVELRPPIGYVAGLYARRDLGRGPHSAPANETILAAVALEHPIDDAVNAAVYDAGINVLRSFPGLGIQVWGARTLRWVQRDSATDALAFVNVRRCLSAIERTVFALGQRVVFEPHTYLLRIQLGQSTFGYLMEVFESGALAGATPEQAFFVRCDDTNNTAESLARGELICDVGVAIAAPAEFIVFRVGRREGVVEIREEAA